jgi:hypothetical protein
MGNQINFLIIGDPSQKNKVKLNLTTQLKTAEGQYVQNGFVVCYHFQPDVKTLAWKSADSQIYITVKEE